MSRRNHGDRYKGFRLSPEVTGIERIEQPSTEVFYRKYVSQRKPCIITGLPNEIARDQWTLSNLVECAGDQTVVVEHRETTRDTFGLGKETKMLFRKFIEHIEKGSEAFYLTTQDLAEVNGKPEFMAAPMRQFYKQQLFPARPAILHSLVPCTYNVWMGNSRDGSCSGLHHDYHDNLYVLISGRKRFELFSPADCDKMYTHGEMALMHPNGRICYPGGLVQEDGIDVLTFAARQRSEAAQQQLMEAEAARDRGDPGADELVAAAEREFEDAFDALVEEESGGQNDEDIVDSADDLVEDDGAPAPKGNKRFKRSHAAVEEPAAAGSPTPKHPDSFSQVDINNPDVVKFPQFSRAAKATTIVNAGEMLYLPAGWFHNVTSFSPTDDDDGGAVDATKASTPAGTSPSSSSSSPAAAAAPTSSSTYHLAINYWFHPPSNMQPDGVGRPYSTDYWEDDWADRFDYDNDEQDFEGEDEEDEEDEGNNISFFGSPGNDVEELEEVEVEGEQ